MTFTPSPEPEFRGKTLTPVSPRPRYVPDPSSIPVLEKQMDQTFNNTATHLPSGPETTAPPILPIPDAVIPPPGETSSVSSTYENTTSRPDGEHAVPAKVGDENLNDDYAMSLDLDDDEEVAAEVGYATIPAPPGLPGDPSVPVYGQDDVSPTPIHTLTAPDVTHHLGDSANATGVVHIPPDLATPIAHLRDSLEVSPPVVGSTHPPSETNLSGIALADSSGVAKQGVNIEALLESLSPTTAILPTAGGLTAATTSSLATANGGAQARGSTSPTKSFPTLAPLPPRPPPSEKSSLHPGLLAQNDLPSYPGRPQSPAGPPSNAPSAPAALRAPAPGGLTPALSTGAPGTTNQLGASLPPPPVATFQQPLASSLSAVPAGSSPSIAPSDKGDGKNAQATASAEDDDGLETWGPEIQRIYDDFLQEERVYVSDGQWDRFPPNSRLFIGNLPTEKVTKRDLFQVFYKHGKLAQVSIKQAYGFIQFLDASACHRALVAEQGQTIRGRKMHLEISKPQKNTRNASHAEGGGARAGVSRRSRSPDYSRGAGTSTGSPRAGAGPSGRFGGDRTDRAFDKRSGRDRGFAEPARGRDDYRPPRSPSPRGYRGRDEYRGGRERNRERDRYERRSRSRSPYSRGGRYRSRTPPTREQDEDANLPLPRRAARDIPETQFIVMDELDRAFVSFVDKTFRDRGIQTDVLFLNPRLPLGAVIRRQILEGVQAVSRLTRESQMSVKIPLQVFDRRGGVDNVRFEEYEDLEPHIAAELVVRAKQTHGAPSLNPYGTTAPPFHSSQYGPTFAAPSQPAAPVGPNSLERAPSAATAPNIANLITALDGPTLQKLLGALQQQGPGAAQSQQHAHEREAMDKCHRSKQISLHRPIKRHTRINSSSINLTNHKARHKPPSPSQHSKCKA
ncbi:MAG: hypothetical protein M1838_004678 [Thelocarpon superellum]|nr:MAG: hypothetical protein M1838_004678 [Thelocarpon superellum]